MRGRPTGKQYPQSRMLADIGARLAPRSYVYVQDQRLQGISLHQWVLGCMRVSTPEEFEVVWRCMRARVRWRAGAVEMVDDPTVCGRVFALGNPFVRQLVWLRWGVEHPGTAMWWGPWGRGVARLKVAVPGAVPAGSHRVVWAGSGKVDSSGPSAVLQVVQCRPGRPWEFETGGVLDGLNAIYYSGVD